MTEKVKFDVNETLEDWVTRMTSKTDEELAEFNESIDHVLEVAELCEQVRNTISFRELHLLLLIRCSRRADFHMFYKAAQLNYDSFWAVKRLDPANRVVEVEN